MNTWKSWLLLATVIAVPLRGATRASMSVTATVAPFLRSTVVRQTDLVSIAREDVVRGFVEVAGPVLEVRTNDRRGYVAIVRVSPGIAAAVRVIGFSQEFEAAGSPVFVAERFQSPQTTLALRYRLTLAENVEAGDYRVPVSVEILRAR